MAARNASSVPINGLSYKRNVPLTVVVTLSGEFLPIRALVILIKYCAICLWSWMTLFLFESN